MSYTRDKDAYTRGPGAIAASDYGNPRRARERREIQMRSRARDKRLANLTLGPRGGMGTIDANKLGAGTLRRPQVQSGGGEAPKASWGGPVIQGGTGGGALTTFNPGGPFVTAATTDLTQTMPTVGVVRCSDGSLRPLLPDGTDPCVAAGAGSAVAGGAASPPSSGMSTGAKVAIGALLLGGAYYLYQRNKRGGG